MNQESPMKRGIDIISHRMRIGMFSAQNFKFQSGGSRAEDLDYTAFTLSAYCLIMLCSVAQMNNTGGPACSDYQGMPLWYTNVADTHHQASVILYMHHPTRTINTVLINSDLTYNQNTIKIYETFPPLPNTWIST